MDVESSVDPHLEVLDAYLRGRRQWFQTTPAVRICWPARDSIRIDEETARGLVARGRASAVDPTCRDQEIASEGTQRVLNIFEVRIEHDTARVLAGQNLDVCLGIEERGVLTRAVVLGKDTDPRRPSGAWTVREIVLGTPPGGDCVMISPRAREM
jgi:hypothetical protein